MNFKLLLATINAFDNYFSIDEHTKKWVVFMLDGQPVYAAVLGMPLSRQVAIRIGAGGLTEDEAKHCLDVVKSAPR